MLARYRAANSARCFGVPAGFGGRRGSGSASPCLTTIARPQPGRSLEGPLASCASATFSRATRIENPHAGAGTEPRGQASMSRYLIVAKTAGNTSGSFRLFPLGRTNSASDYYRACQLARTQPNGTERDTLAPVVFNPRQLRDFALLARPSARHRAVPPAVRNQIADQARSPARLQNTYRGAMRCRP